MDRRTFLRGLFTAAVATQLPHLPRAEAEALTDELVKKFPVIMANGQKLTPTITEVGNGWFKLVARFTANPSGMSLQFSDKGLHVDEGDEFTIDTKECIFSGYFKPSAWHE